MFLSFLNCLQVLCRSSESQEFCIIPGIVLDVCNESHFTTIVCTLHLSLLVTCIHMLHEAFSLVKCFYPDLSCLFHVLTYIGNFQLCKMSNFMLQILFLTHHQHFNCQGYYNMCPAVNCFGWCVA